MGTSSKFVAGPGEGEPASGAVPGGGGRPRGAGGGGPPRGAGGGTGLRGGPGGWRSPRGGGGGAAGGGRGGVGGGGGGGGGAGSRGARLGPAPPHTLLSGRGPPNRSAGREFFWQGPRRPLC